MSFYKNITKFYRNNRKKCYFILSIILVLGIFLFIFYYYRHSNNFKDSIISINNNNFSDGSIINIEGKEFTSDIVSGNNYNLLIEGDFLDDGLVTEEEQAAMAQNTRNLQNLIDNAQEGQVIVLPSGIFYFSSGGINTRKSENYVIKLRSNVTIVGAGTEEDISNKYTILKPYAPSGTIEYGLDMFYWNELSDSYGENLLYLEDVNFSGFIIDGESVRGNTYNTSGKGFMINLCRDCDWYNIIVRNTDATGFGMDNVINGTIVDCMAINCGKNAKSTSAGASGFGIGIGYSEEESMYIKNCQSIGNTKFGFFFEHQGIFNNYYNALKANGFVVEDSYARGNLYNFGGERAHDVVYINCTSGNILNEDYTMLDVYFSDQSRRVDVINLDTDIILNDVRDGSYYYDAVYWALKNNITNGVSKTKFGVGQYITRAQAVTLLWRMADRPGKVLSTKDLNVSNRKVTNILTGFNDVSGSSSYANAIKWAKDEGIINGVTSTTFKPDDYITRAQMIMILWRYAGFPKVNTTNSFNDISKNDSFYDAVNWAYNKKIVIGISNNKFSPHEYCTRQQVVTFLYRYQKSMGSNFPISYILFGGKVSGNKSNYLSGTDTFILNNPAREGYTFCGWTGSNGNSLLLNVEIDKDDVGSKKYIANYRANKYEISYNSNGGMGFMSNTKAVYDKFVELEKNIFVKDGYEFKGWSLKKDGDVIYLDSDIVKNLTSDNEKIVTLYAVWE